MAYDTTNRTFKIYSEDYSLIGPHAITLGAFLTDYSMTKTAPQAVTTTIEIVDPCIDPDVLRATKQSEIADYSYTLDPKIDFTMTPFEVFPPTCKI